MIGLTSLAVVVATLSAPRVHTALGELHACLPLERGYVVASSGGLVELDAELKVTRVRTVLDGLPGTRVDTLVAAGDSVWAGTEAGLVQLRERDEGMAIVATWASAPVRAIVAYAGATYVGTWGGGVLKLDGGRLVPVPPKADGDVAARRVTSFAEVAGVLYVGTAGAGVLKLSGGHLFATGWALPNDHVWALAAKEGALWVGTLAGLAVGTGSAMRTVMGSDTRSLVVVAGGLYAGTYGDGLVAVEAGREDGEAAFVDGIGARGEAMCSVGPGILRVRNGNSWREVALSGLPSNDIAALAVAGERVWIGTFDQGLARLEGGRVEAVQLGEVDPHINALAVERTNGELWIGTARGLFVADGVRVRRIGRVDGLPDEEIHALAPLADGGIAIGTGRGVVIWRDGHVELIGKKQGLPGQAVWAVAEDRAGRLWIGTSAGLIVWHGDGRWERLSVASKHLSDDWVTALTIDPSSGDTVWVGSYAGGVTRLEIGADVGGLDVSALQLGGGHVNFGGLTVHRGNVYASTMEGLQVRSTDRVGTWKASVATLGVDVTGVVADSGGIWVATRRGMSRWTP